MSSGWSFFPNKKPINEFGEDNEANWNHEDKKALEELKRALREYYNGENIQNRSRQLATLKMFGSWDAAEEDDDSNSPNNWEDEDVRAWRQFCQDMSCFDDEQTQRRKYMYETEAQDEVDSVKANPVVDQAIWPIAIVRNSMKMNEQAMDDALFEAMKERRNTTLEEKTKKKKNDYDDIDFHDDDDDDDDASSVLSGRSGIMEEEDDPTTTIIVPTSSVGCSPSRRKTKKRNNNNKKKKQKKLLAKKTPHVDVVFVSQDRYRQAHGVEVMATPRDRVRDVYAGQGLAKF